MVELEHVLELMTPRVLPTDLVREATQGFGHSQQELATERIIEALEDARDQGFLPECSLQYTKARLQSALFR
ncbi:hypothetical protein CYG49_02800 [Candidatus Saccharibacteria bacterium]|nr:MAG: hypothetical protein CYG49_02800 [Candidatus Saccharibacteria bacterium]